MRILTMLAAAAVLMALTGCAPTNGTIIGVSGSMAGSTAPDIQFQSSNGDEGSFTKVRYELAVVAFAPPRNDECCQLDPKVVDISNDLWNLPVTVAQIFLPNDKCPHGPTCTDACKLQNKRIMAFCDANRIAWKAYGRPAPGALILLGPRNKVLMTGSLDHPGAVVAEAKRLGWEEEQQARGDRLESYP